MMKPKALRTKNKIIEVAFELMQQQGYEGTTVEEIIKYANISVGTFYHYFKSKADILHEGYKTLDKYFEEYVADRLLAESTPIEKIITFFHHYALHTSSVGVENVRSIYSMNNPMFTKRRQMEIILEDIIKAGQEKGELTTDETPEEIRRFFFVLIRGLVNDWCIHNGDYDLEKEVDKFVKIQIRAFRP